MTVDPSERAPRDDVRRQAEEILGELHVLGTALLNPSGCASPQDVARLIAGIQIRLRGCVSDLTEDIVASTVIPDFAPGE